MIHTFYSFLVLLTIFLLSACYTTNEPIIGAKKIFSITHADSGGRIISETWSARKLEAIGTQEISSKYFDRAMHWSDSRFFAINFSHLVKRFALKRGEDAVLLNCFDDYQGILLLNDVHRYDLRLATKIKIAFGYFKPNWLHPLLILVPDGKRVPFQERFMTANIREIKFVRLKDYYAPLEKMLGNKLRSQEGFQVFKNNCLFCHSLKGRGGNKGGHLIKKYEFLDEAGRSKFLMDFKNFHNKNNNDKQDFQQFVTYEKLERIIDYLVVIGGSQK
jgi:hypothetical protein